MGVLAPGHVCSFTSSANLHSSNCSEHLVVQRASSGAFCCCSSQHLESIETSNNKLTPRPCQ